jgi:23S rRNA (guanosine2251-2'-O)-methyltransferase
VNNIVVIAHDIRSTHNVGSLLRTCEGLGVAHIYFTGYTPFPLAHDDTRLPHIARKLTAQIQKTALGAESLVPWSHIDDAVVCIAKLKTEGYSIVALEQTPDSIPLPDYRSSGRIALLLGREVEGIEPAILKLCDISVEIPMFGHKESFNVVEAASMALYQFRFG